MPRRPILILATVCLVLAALLAGWAVWGVLGRTSGASGSAGSSGGVATTTQGPQVGGSFQLVNQDGQAVDESLLLGKWSLVFFGYTYCPDYCPATLGTLEAVRQRLGAQAENLQIIFVSVDPERDTSGHLKDYLSSDGFPPGVIGLTGSPDQIRQVASAYRVLYSKEGEGETYMMQHSLTVYLMGPDGRFRLPLSHDLAPDRAAQVVRNAMARG